MKKVALLILSGAELLEISPFTDVFGWGNTLKKSDIQIVTFGFSKEIPCSWNIKISPEVVINEKTVSLHSTEGIPEGFESLCLEDFSGVVIPGGFGSSGYFKNLENPLLQKFIQHFISEKKIVLGVCTGSLLLGELEFLKNRKATTYLFESGRYFSQLEKMGAIPISEEIVRDENIITTSSPASALKSAFLLLEILSGKDSANLIKKEMGFVF